MSSAKMEKYALLHCWFEYWTAKTSEMAVQ